MVEVVFYLMVLEDDVIGVDQSQVRRVHADVASKEVKVFHFVQLAVWADVWGCPFADALDVNVLLNLCEFSTLLRIPE